MLIETILTAKIQLFCVIGIIQDELLYLHNVLLLMIKCYIVLLTLLHTITCFS